MHTNELVFGYLPAHHCFLDTEKCGCKEYDLGMGEGQEIQLWGMPAHATQEGRARVWEVE